MAVRVALLYSIESVYVIITSHSIIFKHAVVCILHLREVGGIVWIGIGLELERAVMGIISDLTIAFVDIS